MNTVWDLPSARGCFLGGDFMSSVIFEGREGGEEERTFSLRQDRDVSFDGEYKKNGWLLEKHHGLYV